MPRRWASLLFWAGLLAVAVGGYRSASFFGPVKVKLFTGTRGGEFIRLGNALEEIMYNAGFTFRVQTTDGSLANIKAIQDDSSAGIGMAEVSTAAIGGEAG